MKIKCDSCFINDRSDGQTKIAPPSDAADEGFPKVLREVMFCAVSDAVLHGMQMHSIQMDPIGVVSAVNLKLDGSAWQKGDYKLWTPFFEMW